MVLKNAIDKQNELIDKKSRQLNELQSQRAALIGNTCEKYAKDRMNDFYMIKSFYKDKDLNEVLFSEEIYDQLEDHDIKKYIFNYNQIFVKTFNHIKNHSLRSFLYFSQVLQLTSCNSLSCLNH